jgi:hypothetical protein
MHRSVAFAFVLLVACKDKSAEVKQEPAPAAPAPSAPAPSAAEPAKATTPPPAAPADGATASFELNGSVAATAPRPGDGEKNSGTVSASSAKIQLHIAGGAADWPKRGWLMMNAKSFAFAPGKLQDAKATYVWYRGKDNGGDANYLGPMDIEITSLTEVEQNAVGRKWKAAGTFSGELKLMTGFKADIPTMKITNGKFENLEIQEVGKKK